MNIGFDSIAYLLPISGLDTDVASLRPTGTFLQETLSKFEKYLTR